MISRRNFLRLIGLAPAVPVLAAATAERTFASGGMVSGFGALVGEIGPPMTLLPDGGSVMFPVSQIAEVGGGSWSGRVDLQSAGEIVSALTAEEEGPMSDASKPMNREIPVLRLSIECAMTNPPKPTGIGVYDDKKLIGIMTLDELRACAARLEELEAALKEVR